ncbi:MAG: hypothetical protein V3R92_00690 [Dehalococcoidales bacterium]
MRKRWFLAGVVLLLVPWVVAGCGVAQEMYDSTVSELDKAKSEVESVKAGLEAAEAKVAEMAPDLEKAKSEFEAARVELEAVEAKVAELTASVEKATADNSALDKEKEKLQSSLTVVNDELAEIKKIYPPRDFNSRMELEDWLLANDVSEKPITSTAEGWYSRALEVQADALADGYVVSVDYDGPDEEGAYAIFCTTIISGSIWYWDPETDEVFQDTYLAGVK